MFIFLDTETTGTGPHDRLCQIAFKPEDGPAVSGLFNPGMSISIDAMAVHHITNKMVQDTRYFLIYTVHLKELNKRDSLKYCHEIDSRQFL